MRLTVPGRTSVAITIPVDPVVTPFPYTALFRRVAAMVAWAGRASVSGGCDPQLSNNAATASVLCTGGATTITWTATDLCMSPTLTRTFTVTAPEDVVITAPADTIVNACDYADQAALNAAIVAWAGRASVSGGCDPQLRNR